MARGNEILVNANPKGNFTEGVIATGEYPGTIMQVDPTVALAGGRHTYKVFSRAANGDRPKGAYWVLLPDSLQGKTATQAYTAGDRCFLYSPLPGDELNLLFGNQAGTADDVALGDNMIVINNSGKILTTSGTPQTEIAVALEAIVDPVADQLLWVQFGR